MRQILSNSVMLIAMASPGQINSLIINQLAGGEKRVLSLVVAVRNALGASSKGDISGMVKSALRKLVASGAITDADGMYGLSPAPR